MGTQMTDIEIKRKLAKKAGIPEQGQQLFFELFLQHTGSRLKTGETLKIDDTGFFSLKKCEIINEYNDDVKKGSSSEAIFFYDYQDKTEEENYLIFNIPSKGLTVHPLDKYFSLSFGKPTLQFGSSINDIFIPPSESELKNLYNNKIENLIQNSEIFNSEGDENTIFIVEEKIPGRTDSIEPVIVESIPVVVERVNPENVTGLNSADLMIDSESRNKVDEWKIELPSVENPPSELIEGGFKEALSNEEYLKDNPGKESSETYQKSVDDNGYKYVEPLTSGFESPDNPDKISNNLKDITFKTDIIDEIDEDGYSEVNLKYSDEELLENYTKDFDETDDLFDDNLSYSSVVAEETLKSFDSQTDSEVHQIKKKSRKGLIIALIVLLFVGAAGTYYFYYMKKNPVPVNQELAASEPVVIKRDYTVPVKYPYDEAVNTNLSETDPFEPGSIKNTLDNSASSDVNSSDNESNIKQPIETAKLSDAKKISSYIYRIGNEFIVQVSSWKFKRNADSHAEELKSKGFNSYVEKGSGSYYKVRIRGFNSLEEAQNFLKKK
jgi:hypothetical protein